MNVLDLFSGIGGFSLGLERAGMRTVAFCEIDPYCRRVLAKHWPDVPIYGDIRELTAETLGVTKSNGRGSGRTRRSDPAGAGQQQPERPLQIDLIAGGFPCQDISVAGKGAGIGGERSGLWSEYARIIGEVRPRYVIVENVAALLGRGLATVLGDLAALGFDAEWHCIPASAVGAPHRRDRLWIVAYSRCVGNLGWSGECRRPETSGPCDRPARSGQHTFDVADADQPRLERWLRESLRECADQCAAGAGSPSPDTHGQPTQRLAISWGECGQWITEPDVGRVAHGVPARVDRLRALGNAVVPQIPELIGRAIMSIARAALEPKP